MPKPFKKPNLNAPRSRIKKKIVSAKTLQELMFKKFPEYGRIDTKKLEKVVTTFSKLLVNEAIENRDGVELPEKIGNIFIGSCEEAVKKGPFVDYGKSKKAGVVVKYRNLHTDGRLGKIFYTNCLQRYLFKWRELWEFEGHRDFTRTVAEVYAKDWKKYIEIDRTYLVSKLFQRQRFKDYMQTKQKTQLENYNELEL